MPEHTRDMIDAMIDDWMDNGAIGNLVVKVNGQVALALTGRSIHRITKEEIAHASRG